MQKVIFCLSQILILALSIRTIPVRDPENITIAFGSCFSQEYMHDDPAEIFTRIIETKPDLWVWIGDAAYLDIKKDFIVSSYFIAAGDQEIKDSFNMVKNNKNYTALRSKMPVIGIWDDHDYGIDNGDKTFEKKDYVREQFLDFLDEPKNSTRRTNPGGMYDSYYVGDPSRVKVILLDVRYQRDPKKVGKDMLGDLQWKWFEEELKTNTAEYIVIGSGTQFLPVDRLMAEVWFTESLDRMLALIRKYKIGKVVLMTGDVHYAEIMKYPCNDRVGFELYEVTSSGMTHILSDHLPFARGFVYNLYADTYNTVKERLVERNFGLLEFTFGKTGGVNLDIRSDYGKKTALQKYLPARELEFDQSRLNMTGECILDKTLNERAWMNIKQRFFEGEIYLFVFVGFLLAKLLLVVVPAFILILILERVYRKMCNKKLKKD